MDQPTALPAPGRSRGRVPRRRWPKLREDLCGRDARAPGWASSHDRVTPTDKVQKHIGASCRCHHLASFVHPRMIRTAGRGLDSRANGSFPKGTPARRIPSTSPSGRHPPGARASRPHAVPSVAAQFPCDVAADRPAGGNRMGPAEAEAGRRCRLIPVEEMAEAAGGFVRAGRPRSRVGFLP